MQADSKEVDGEGEAEAEGEDGVEGQAGGKKVWDEEDEYAANLNKPKSESVCMVLSGPVLVLAHLLGKVSVRYLRATVATSHNWAGHQASVCCQRWRATICACAPAWCMRLAAIPLWLQAVAACWLPTLQPHTIHAMQTT